MFIRNDRHSISQTHKISNSHHESTNTLALAWSTLLDHKGSRRKAGLLLNSIFSNIVLIVASMACHPLNSLALLRASSCPSCLRGEILLCEKYRSLFEFQSPSRLLANDGHEWAKP